MEVDGAVKTLFQEFVLSAWFGGSLYRAEYLHNIELDNDWLEWLELENNWFLQSRNAKSIFLCVIGVM